MHSTNKKYEITDANFFENRCHKLLIEIPISIPGVSYDSGEVYKHLKEGFSKIPPVTERHIKKALGKSLPIEFYLFYSSIGLLNYYSERESTPATIVKAEKMMNSNYTPLSNIDEEYIQKKKYQKSPF